MIKAAQPMKINHPKTAVTIAVNLSSDDFVERSYKTEMATITALTTTLIQAFFNFVSIFAKTESELPLLV
jgi:hypothetical protein